MTLRLALSLAAAITLAGPARAGEPPRVYEVEDTGEGNPLPVFPANEALAEIPALPNPFEPTLGGEVDASFASWEQRRTEVMAAIQHYEIGQRPHPDDVEITAAYVPGELTVVITRPSNGRSVVLTSAVNLPLGEGPFPAVITMEPVPGAIQGNNPNTGPQGLGIPNEVWDSRGVARIDFYHDQLTTWVAGAGVPHQTDPYYQLYPEHYPPGEVGQYSAWSWGVSRLIDGIEIATQQAVGPLPIDLDHLAVTGCSYAGKMSLFAGAFDERIALTIPQESGGGGIPAWRISHAIEAHGSVEKIDNTNYNWFRTRLREFSGDDVYFLPHDHHQLMALVAPRALLVTSNTSQMWLSNRSGYAASRAAETVYETFGIEDRFGFTFTTGYAHCIVPEHLEETLGLFIDKFMLGQERDTASVRVRPASYDDPASTLFVDWESWQPWSLPEPGRVPALLAGAALLAALARRTPRPRTERDSPGGGRIMTVSKCWTSSALLLAAALSLAAPASAGHHVVPAPVVEGPITGGIHGRPWESYVPDYGPYSDITQFGYVEEEFFVSGTSDEETPFKTRILVRRPSDPADFSGTVFAEWLNVSGATDSETTWPAGHPVILTEGHAYVAMSVQAVGITELRAWDPVRYGSLVSHLSDHDDRVMEQLLQAVRSPAGIDPMGGLQVDYVIVSGDSQSASKLEDYIREGYEIEGLIDGFMPGRNGGSATMKRVADELQMPFIVMLEENQGERPPDSEHFRVFFGAGQSHAPWGYWEYLHMARERDLYMTSVRPVPEDAAGRALNGGTGGMNRSYANPLVRAAFHWINRMVRGEGSPPHQPRLVRNADGSLVRNADGYPLGGIRYPDVTVPIGLNTSAGYPLWGIWDPWSADEIIARYPTRQVYLDAIEDAIGAMAPTGMLLPIDADLVRADAAALPVWDGAQARACYDEGWGFPPDPLNPCLSLP